MLVFFRKHFLAVSTIVRDFVLSLYSGVIRTATAMSVAVVLTIEFLLKGILDEPLA